MTLEQVKSIGNKQVFPQLNGLFTKADLALKGVLTHNTVEQYS
jgi:hypothetical protein